MKKNIFLLALMITSCSFIIDTNYNNLGPRSTHIPNIDTGKKIFSELRGTMWRSEENSKDKDTYLYIDINENKYAIKTEKKNMVPNKYPANHSYTLLGKEEALASASSLKFYDTVIFQEQDNRNQYIGFHLQNSCTLYTAESTGSSTELINNLEQKKGRKWRLYR
ncbi:MAG: hypothetical protein KFW21_05350 [Spirochaetota bacterium]|nr:hypothetical protein [Spirochaetota bacterium]